MTQFNPTVAVKDNHGGRFDSIPSDPYAYLYGTSDDTTAVCEALLRDFSFDEARMLPRVQVAGKRISWLFTTVDLEIVTLRSGEDLAQIGQDTWLTHSSAEDYHMTREWASAIRRWAPSACGLTWPSRREPAGFAYVFFEDRCPDTSLADLSVGLPLDSPARALDSGVGAQYLSALLRRYSVTVSPPSGNSPSASD